MDKYIQKLNFNFITNQRVMQLIASIDEYSGKWNVVEKHENRYLKEFCCFSRHFTKYIEKRFAIFTR